MRPFSWSLALEAKLMKCMDAELPKELDGLSFLAFMQDPTCNPKKTLRFISRYSSFIVLRCGVISITDRFSQTFTFSFTYILPQFFLLFCPFFTSAWDWRFYGLAEYYHQFHCFYSNWVFFRPGFLVCILHALWFMLALSSLVKQYSWPMAGKVK